MSDITGLLPEKPPKTEVTQGVPRPQELSYRLWNVLVDEAQYDVEGENTWVWDGKITALGAELDISQPYAAMIWNHLIRMGCVQRVRRGGGGRTSQIALVMPPTDELWLTGNNVRSQTQQDTTHQQIRDLANRVNDLEKKMEALISG